MRERHALEPAFVLHRRPYRESSAILDLITRTQGRIALVARGARRARGGSRGLSEPFTPLLVSWTARGDLGTLTALERAMPSVPLRGAALLSGLYLNELLMRLTHRNDPLPELFQGYAQTVAVLASFPEANASDVEPHLRRFERRLLDELGYGLALDRCADGGGPIEEQRLYAYRPQHGAFPAVGGRVAPGEIRVHGATLLALANDGELDSRARAEAKRLMRAEIDRHLGQRPLESRRLFGGADPSR